MRESLRKRMKLLLDVGSLELATELQHAIKASFLDVEVRDDLLKARC
jgi:hypothetical protein